MDMAVLVDPLVVVIAIMVIGVLMWHEYAYMAYRNRVPHPQSLCAKGFRKERQIGSAPRYFLGAEEVTSFFEIFFIEKDEKALAELSIFPVEKYSSLGGEVFLTKEQFMEREEAYRHLMAHGECAIGRDWKNYLKPEKYLARCVSWYFP